MGQLIRLRLDQTQYVDFKHELLDHANDYKLTDAEYKQASWEQKQLSKLWLVRRIVGRYLYHWPVTHTWLDDMCSAAMEGLCEHDDLSDNKALMNSIQHRIENTLNSIQSIVGGSLATNKRRSAEGKDLEYVESVPINNMGKKDPNLELEENLEQLTPRQRKKYDEYTS